MPRKVPKKCLHCALLDCERAHELHGPTGDGCWDSKTCPDRRYYYRNQAQRKAYKKSRYRSQLGVEGEGDLATVPASGKTVSLSLPTIAFPNAVLHWYRKTKASRIHAIGAELWMGNERVAVIEPVHTAGLTPIGVKTLLGQMLELFSSHTGNRVAGFTEEREIEPSHCPLANCPLRAPIVSDLGEEG
ncbi:hypothetical protein K9N68_38435 (plasmid) [Kovacikia minuta CCNUW1]|uniref:hypothetical protein n=1 Tax=Kovacikia minuta TaxID=2931930 RepID=UPI001CCDA171|nr:hypothetical protein [Kovacikia minuta]UBF30068.1 hypothetical protein K9N68_38435 [Kovacikia minuta CCNUW1]